MQVDRMEKKIERRRNIKGAACWCSRWCKAVGTQGGEDVSSE